ncbi:NmrA/HSCARG family protein [Nocardia coubleae]|uniref:NmrA/HSCARG family protein n=1 Tax=Nocardia coubleae TaxID=356147 RepID=A0A846W0X5_9NOCA|nr:NmrA/HSCARG family protein [Nocardia coubleae]NKX86533.1 NmrA/HSCARG family protein [Nocardia coubleae]
MTTTLAPKTVLVTGATGGQGGAVARGLLGGGWRVRALVRDPHTPAARELTALGAELVTGDLDDPASLRAAAHGAHGVFSVQPADLTAPQPETEVRQGKNVADAAAAVGAAHLVYSSVGAARHKSGVAHFETKAEIEAHIEALGVPATVLRPVFFMENWRHLMPEVVDGERVGSLALGSETTLQMIALADIGSIAVEVFGNADEFIGEQLDIAGDQLTPRQIARMFTEFDGIPTRFTRQPVEELRGVSGELAAMFSWLDEHGYEADIHALRRRFPQLLTFENWLRGPK